VTHPEEREAAMIAQWLLGLLADAVFNSVASTRQSYASEIDQYLQRRNPARRPAALSTSAR